MDEAFVPAYTLPDPLRLTSGEAIRDAALWRAGRRAEMLALFQTHVYERRPSATVEARAAVTSSEQVASQC